MFEIKIDTIVENLISDMQLTENIHVSIVVTALKEANIQKTNLSDEQKKELECLLLYMFVYFLNQQYHAQLAEAMTAKGCLRQGTRWYRHSPD